MQKKKMSKAIHKERKIGKSIRSTYVLIDVLIRPVPRQPLNLGGAPRLRRLQPCFVVSVGTVAELRNPGTESVALAATRSRQFRDS